MACIAALARQKRHAVLPRAQDIMRLVRWSYALQRAREYEGGSTTMPWVDEISSDSDHCLVSFGPLLIQFWMGTISPRVCNALTKTALELAPRHRDGKLSVLSVALPSALVPDRQARRALASLSQATEQVIARIAIVREGPGFAASALTAVAAGIQLIAGAAVPRKTFTDLAEAARWVTQPLPDFAVGRILIEDAVDALTRKRRLLSEHP